MWESRTSTTNSSKMRDCEMALHQDGRLVIRSSVLGVVYWNVSTVPGGDVVSWVLRLNLDDGSLTVTDIEDSARPYLVLKIVC